MRHMHLQKSYKLIIKLQKILKPLFTEAKTSIQKKIK